MFKYSQFYKKFNDHVNDYPGKLHMLICKRAAMYMSKHYKKQLVKILEHNNLLQPYESLIQSVNGVSAESLNGYSREGDTLTVIIGTKSITYTMGTEALIDSYFKWETDLAIIKGFFNLDFNLDLIYLHSFFYNNKEKERKISI